MERLTPSVILAAYAAPLIEGRRVIVFGDCTSGLAEQLVERGARLVHVYDDDLGRVTEGATRNASRNISYAPLGQSGVAVRDGAFEFGLIENLATFSKPDELLRRLRRALAARGVGLVATPNLEVSEPLLAAGESARSGPNYYELYDLVSEEFDEVRMLGQAPFLGYTIAEFVDEETESFAIDTSLVSEGSEELEWFLALVSHFSVSLEPFEVVQVPRRNLIAASPVDATEREALERSNAQLTAEVERLRKAERRHAKASEDEQLLQQARKELTRRDAWVKELEARAATADERADEVQAELEQLRTQLETPNPPKADTEERKQLDSIRKELAETQGELRSAKEQLDRQKAAAEKDTAEKGKTEQRAEQEKKAAQERTTQLEQAVKSAKQELEAARREHKSLLQEIERQTQRLETQLQERGEECARLQRELDEARRVGAELLAELQELKAGSAAESAPQSEVVAELEERLDQIAASEARRVADLAAAEWTIRELEAALHKAQELNSEAVPQ